MVSPIIFLSALVLLCISGPSHTAVSHSRRHWLGGSYWGDAWQQKYSRDDDLDDRDQWGGWNRRNSWRRGGGFKSWSKQRVSGGERGWNRDDALNAGGEANYNSVGTTSSGNPVNILLVNSNTAGASNENTAGSGWNGRTVSSGWNANANSNGWTGLTGSSGWKGSSGVQGATGNIGDGTWVTENGGSGWNAERGLSQQSSAFRQTKIRKTYSRSDTVKLDRNNEVF